MTSVTTDQRQGVNASASVKVACIAASTANLTLSGEQTVDGVALVTDDRCLVKDQTDATENGIYVVGTSAWSRAPDWDGAYDVVEGTLIPVNQGTTNLDSIWRVTTTGTITIGTTSVAFESAIASLNEGVPFGFGVSEQSTDYSIVPADNGKTIVATHATGMNVTLLSAASAGDKFKVAVHAGGTGTATIVGTVGALSSPILNAGESMLIVCDGSVYEGFFMPSYLSGRPLGWAINAQTGTTYSMVAADNGKVVVGDHATNITITLLSAATAGNNYKAFIHAGNAGTVTISGTVGALSSPVLASGETLYLSSDGSVYEGFIVPAYPTSISNYSSSRLSYHENNAGSPSTSIVITSVVTVATWESVGPTGSGADNVWTALDDYPTGVNAVEFKSTMLLSGATTATHYERDLYGRNNGDATAAGAITLVQTTAFTNRSGSTEEDYALDFIKIPCTTGAVFDVYWQTSGTSPGGSITAYLRAFYQA